MKKIFRRLISFSICIVMITTMMLSASANSERGGYLDVKRNNWFYNSVNYVSDKGLMVGVNMFKFSPYAKFTRAMTVKVLAELSGDNISKYEANVKTFPDVAECAWYASSVEWAFANDIVAGIDGKFKPNDSVTREQLACMIHRFCVKYKISISNSGNESAVNNFSDKNNISQWAIESVEWALSNGVLSGVGNNKLDPQGTANRAQAARLFYVLDYLKTNKKTPPADNAVHITPSNEELDMLKMINEERKKKNIAPLSFNYQIYDCARIRAKESSVSFKHTRPNGKMWFTVYEDFGISTVNASMGENIAINFANAEEAMAKLCASQGHYENMISPYFTSIAIGMYKQENGYYAISQLFWG